ncbi:MAG: glycosyltransferase [Pseudomonadota bacterium]
MHIIHPLRQSGVPRVFSRPPLFGPNALSAWIAAVKYGPWAEKIWAMAASLDAPKAETTPRISLIVPVFDTEPSYLDALLGSFLSQVPGLAEMILVDDGSTRVETMAWLDAHPDTAQVRTLRLDRNQGIAGATNAGIEAAIAPWVGLVDHDDLIAPHGIKMVVRALDLMPGAQFLYTDEAIAGPNLEARSLFLKPGFDPVLLSGENYVNHLSLYRRDRLRTVGVLDPAFEGSQDYELVLRYCRGLGSDEIVHLPYPAYIWRQHAQSYSHARLDDATTHARSALAQHYAPPGRSAVAEAAPLKPELHRVAFPRMEAEWPKISVVIPNRDSPDLVRVVLDGVLAKTDYPEIELIVVDNGTTDPRTTAIYEHVSEDPRVRIEIRPAPFNFSAMVNRGVALATGAHYLLLNNDIEVEDPGWLKEMVSCLDYPGTGIVGAKLIYPDRRIQHAGVILGLGNLAGHWFYKQPEHTTGPMSRLALRNSLTVVTGAAMLISGPCWQATGRFNEDRFRVAYNDVDYCARARGLGFGVVWTPHAQLVHHESASRGRDDVRRNRERFAGEQAALRELHGTDTFEDPAYSPWWSRFRSRPRRRHRTDLPEPRHFMGFPVASDQAD